MPGMVTVNVFEDRFKGEEANQASDQKLSGSGPSIRRPVRGIVIKEDTYATMRLITGDGKSIKLTDAAGSEGSQTNRQTSVYSNFLLQQVTEERIEKQQILETFGEPYIFFFGERPRMVNFAGILMNTFDFNWEAEWWDNYDKFLRGTKCIEQDARIFLAYDETLVSGYIIAASASKNANDKNHVQFQFTMFLTGYTNFSNIGDGTAAPLRAREDAAQGAAGNLFGVQGPSLLSGQTLTGALAGTVLEQPSLIEGLSTGLSAVVNTWNQAQSLVNNAVQRLSDIARGDILRVPFGFAGALAFDAADLVRIPEIPSFDGNFGTIKYTEFKDNVDEFVGSSSQYANAFTPGLLPSDPLALLAKNQSLVELAKAQWLAAGFLMPPGEEFGVSDFIVSNGAGMLAAGSTAAWQVGNQGQSIDPASATRSSSLPVI